MFDDDLEIGEKYWFYNDIEEDLSYGVYRGKTDDDKYYVVNFLDNLEFFEFVEE